MFWRWERFCSAFSPLQPAPRGRTERAPRRAGSGGGWSAAGGAGGDGDGDIPAVELWLLAAGEGLTLPGWAASGGSGGRAEPAASQGPPGLLLP